MDRFTFKLVEDGQAWNSFALTHPESSFLVSWEWGEFITHYKGGYENYGVYEGETLVALLPLSHVKAKRGNYLHLRHAPVMNWDENELVEFVFEQISLLGKDKGAHFVRISPRLSESVSIKEMLNSYGYTPALTHEVDAERTLIVDTTKDEEQLTKELRKNYRNYLRKAEKIGIEVIHTDGMEHFEEFWNIFTDAVKRNDWVAYSKDYVKKEYEHFAGKGMARMFLSRYEERFISAAIFIYFNDQCVYHHSGSLTEFRKIPATYLLQWEAIKYTKSLGISRHNLWGVVGEDEKDHPWYGLSFFKRGFGGYLDQTVHAHDNILHPFAHVTRFYEMIEKRWRGY